MLHLEVSGLQAHEHDVFNITGNADFGGRIVYKFVRGFAPREGDEISAVLIGGTAGVIAPEIEIRNLAPGFMHETKVGGGMLTLVALNDGVFIPEPTTGWLLAMGGLGLLAYGRGRRRR
jgi:hypothetical protein